MKVPQVIFDYITPIFSWIKCCKKCPSQFPADPESLDILSWPFEERIKSIFPCAWRTKGYCHLNAKQTFYGKEMK